MVVAVEAMDLVHALDFERWHDVEAMVDVDVVHVHVLFEPLAPSVVAMVSIDLVDTVEIERNKNTHLKFVYFQILNKSKLAKSHDLNGNWIATKQRFAKKKTCHF